MIKKQGKEGERGKILPLHSGKESQPSSEWPRSNFRVEVKGQAGDFLKAIKAGRTLVIGVGYYEDMHPITVISSELLPGVGDFQVVTQVNSIYEKTQAVNFQKLVESLSHEYPLEVLNGFPVFRSSGPSTASSLCWKIPAITGSGLWLTASLNKSRWSCFCWICRSSWKR